MKSEDSKDLRVYVVFVPMLGQDNLDTATERVSEFRDDRLTYYWDPQKTSAVTYKNVFGTEQMLWDMYFLYARDIEWKKQPTVPFVAVTGHAPIGDQIVKFELEAFGQATRELIAK